MSRQMRRVRPGDVLHLPDGDHTVGTVAVWNTGASQAVCTDRFTVTLYAGSKWPVDEMTQFHELHSEVERGNAPRPRGHTMITYGGDITTMDALRHAITLMHLERDHLVAAWGCVHPSVIAADRHLAALEKLVKQSTAEKIREDLERTVSFDAALRGRTGGAS